MTKKWYVTRRHPKMHPHIKFGIPTSKNIGHEAGWTDRRTDGHMNYYKNSVRGQGQCHSDMRMVRDTPPSQDAPTHQIWNSYLKEYRRYAPDTKRDRWTVRLLYASQSSFGGIKTNQPTQLQRLPRKSKFALSKSRFDTFQYTNNKGADHTARMRRLVCAFAVSKSLDS